MYIQKMFDKRINKAYLYIREQFRNAKGVTRSRSVFSFGVVTKENEKELWAQAKKKLGEINLTVPQNYAIDIDLNERNDSTEDDKNIGYIILEQIYNSLNIDSYIKNTIHKRNDAYDVNNVIKLLVFSRILNPDSKLETFKGKDGFFADPFKEIKLDNVYDALTELHENETKLQLHIHEQVSKLYNRNLKMVFYDVTNYFFDTDYDDGYDEDGKPLGLRYVGVSKEKRETPIVQMGLLMDEQRIPIAYKLFEGNTHDQRTLVPILEEFKKTFNLKSITIIADKGLNSGSNIDYLLKNNHKFIVSQMVRTRDEKFRSLVLENEGYKWLNDERTFKIKEFKYQRNFRDRETNKVIDNHEFRVIAYWSKAFSDREKHKRGDLEEKLMTFVNYPSKLNASNMHGVKKYLKEYYINKDTGEVKKDDMKILSIDREKYERDVALDGYYAIITNDYTSTPQEIISKYKELVRIEETFRVTKTDLEGRPVYVWTQEHMRGHFLSCFIGLVLIRLLQMKFEWKYSVEELKKALNSANARRMTGEIYLIRKQTPLYGIISKEFGFEVWKKYLKIEDYNKIKKGIKNFNLCTKF